MNSEWKDNADFATWLVKEMKPKTIVDIGTYEGYSAKTFADILENGVNVITVDPARQFDGELPANVIYLEHTSKEAYHDWDRSNKIDILHIDGDHAYETVKEDLINWGSLLNPDGIILMHDVANVSVAGFGPVKIFLGNTIPYKACYFKGYGLGVLTFNKELMEKILSSEFGKDFITGPMLSQYWTEKLIEVIEKALAENPMLTMEKR